MVDGSPSGIAVPSHSEICSHPGQAGMRAAGIVSNPLVRAPVIIFSSFGSMKGSVTELIWVFFMNNVGVGVPLVNGAFCGFSWTRDS